MAAAVLATGGAAKIYSATYSNVPVYEFKVGADSVMRRRSDDWVNATHILKVAGLDKPSRTRILEREVQRGVHEKIQGGYGKYQGTWVPMDIAHELADRNHITDRLQPIFDFVPGDKSPPPAPKHTNAASSSRPRSQKLVAAAAAAGRRHPIGAGGGRGRRNTDQLASSSFMSAPSVSFSQEERRHYSFSGRGGGNGDEENDDDYDDDGNDDDESMAPTNLESSSMVADEDTGMMLPPGSRHSASAHPRKRKRGGTVQQDPAALSIIEQNHIVYGDQLLDYFMTVGDVSTAARVQPPAPPPQFQVDRAIDDQGNTALHWACAMGDLDIVRDLLDRGANIHSLSHHDETPLVRAVLFTNNYEKRTMHDLAELLKHTITFRDWFGATVFNHLAATTRSKGKWKSSRYYAQVLVDKLSEMFPRHEIILLLSSQDSNGDTAALTAAKNGCHKLATTLLAHCPEAGDLQNKSGETANDVLMEISRQFQEQQQQGAMHTEQDQQQQRRRQHHHRHVESLDSNAPQQHQRHISNQFPHPSSDATAVSPSRPYQSHHKQHSQDQTRTSEATAALLERVGAIMDEANRRLARAYGEVKTSKTTSSAPVHPSASAADNGDNDNNDVNMDADGDINGGDTTPRAAPSRDPGAGPQDGNLDNDDPKSVWARIEAERDSLRRQIEKLSSREEQQGEPLEALTTRYSGVRERYASLLERTQRADLQRRFRENKNNQITSNHSNSNSNLNGDDSSPPPPTTTSNDPRSMQQTYDLCNTLLSARQTRLNLLDELVSQRANAGASARMDVHRKLVALATGVAEGDLDPMADALAESLEFERASREQQEQEQHTQQTQKTQQPLENNIGSTAPAVGGAGEHALVNHEQGRRDGDVHQGMDMDMVMGPPMEEPVMDDDDVDVDVDGAVDISLDNNNGA